MDLMTRVQGIILKPKEEWTKIKAEPAEIRSLFTNYAAILAAIPAIANFIGMGLVGRRIPFLGWYRFDFGKAILYAIFAYIFSLVGVAIVGFVINALAPSFSSTPNLVQAMKLSVYSYTPVWVAGILYILPALSPLVILASLYGLYLFYLGIVNPLMETPKEKVLSYSIAAIVVAIVIFVVLGVILASIFAVRGVASGF